MGNIRESEDFGPDDMPCDCSCGNMFDLNDGNPCSQCKNLYCDDCCEAWELCEGCSESEDPQK